MNTLEFNPHNFVDNLSYMGKGMLGIIAVIGIIIIVTVILNAVNKRKK